MRIGIDIDGIITNTIPVMKKYAEKYNREVLNKNLKLNKKGFNTSNLYDWTKEEEEGFVKKYIDNVLNEVTIKDDAKFYIDLLRKEKNEIYIITARRKEYTKLTSDYLKRNGINFDVLAVGMQSKATYCVNNNIDIMLDDEPQNIESISKYIKVLVMEEEYNKNCSGENIIKCNSWQDFYNRINLYKTQTDNI